MKLKIIYMAHPLAGDVEGNINRAKCWMRWIEEKHTDSAVSAGWILDAEIWGDEAEHRAAGLRRDLARLERCDELWLVGPSLTPGMALEQEHAKKVGLRIRDFTSLGLTWPPGIEDPAASR